MLPTPTEINTFLKTHRTAITLLEYTGQAPSGGSGPRTQMAWFYSPSPYLLLYTGNIWNFQLDHVLTNNINLSIRIPGSMHQPLPVSIVAHDTDLGITVVKPQCDVIEHEYIPLSSSRKVLEPGKECWIITQKSGRPTGGIAHIADNRQFTGFSPVDPGGALLLDPQTNKVIGMIRSGDIGGQEPEFTEVVEGWRIREFLVRRGFLEEGFWRV